MYQLLAVTGTNAVLLGLSTHAANTVSGNIRTRIWSRRLLVALTNSASTSSGMSTCSSIQHTNTDKQHHQKHHVKLPVLAAFMQHTRTHT